MKVTILGCGPSGGVPEIGCQCAVCTSTNPKNKRLRVSVLVEAKGKRILIDTSPDLRQQALSNDIRHIDAVLYTHDHADHTHGIDELRWFCARADAQLPIYADAPTLESLQTRFGYAFLPKPEVWYRPSLIAHEIGTLPFEVQGVRVTPFTQRHGHTDTLGFRIGNFAYSTDTNGFSEQSFSLLAGLEVWVVDCLRDTTSHTHATLEQALEWVARMRPKRAILTHMAHQLEYESLRAKLPKKVEPAYDGLSFELAS